MENDFYNIDQRWLASYFEKDWFDKVEKQSDVSLAFNFSKFDSKHLSCNYHSAFVSFINEKVKSENVSPATLLEIGSSLGRNFYECCQKIKSLKSATLVEPSQAFEQTFRQIFSNDAKSTFVTLKGYKDVHEVQFDPSTVRSECANVKFETIVRPFDELVGKLATFDLVVCSNVIDQCKEPRKLIEFLKNSTANNGVLALSCTYQWNDKYVTADEEQITNINELFGDGWKHLGETDIEFRCRRNERYWLTFLSHVSIFQKNLNIQGNK